MRIRAYLRFISLSLLLMSLSCGFATNAGKDLGSQTGSLWAPYVEWQLENESIEGNPFDITADVTFTHEASGEVIRTPMFYVGDNTHWAFRFSGTRSGRWTFTTTSSDADLDGFSGEVIIDATTDAPFGFLVAENQKFAVQTGESGELQGTLYNVYMNGTWETDQVGDFSLEPERLTQQIDVLLDETQANGFNVVFMEVFNNWFKFGTVAHNEHERDTPDPDTFMVLETLITRAHARGLHVHLWMWGDEQRKQTPRGVGEGINGKEDKRLQRYIAARLGPIPGWTMAYGFDLEEWAKPEDVLEWHDSLQSLSGWPHLLTARELNTYKGYTFKLPEPLDIVSTDDRPFDTPEVSFYELALQRFEENAGRPLMFERRFLYTRDDVWTMDATRQALWQFAMAGGAASIWGAIWEDGTPYPNPEQLRIHHDFWQQYFSLDLRVSPELSDGMTLRDAQRIIIYKENTDSITLNLTDTNAVSVFALDTRADSYEELELRDFDASASRWQAPYVSDWVLVVSEN